MAAWLTPVSALKSSCGCSSVLYRALQNLSGGVRRGELTALAHLSADKIARLERLGAIAPVAAPPLSELHGWAQRAGKLAKVGVVTAVDYLEADADVLKDALRVKLETVERYREELRALMTGSLPN